MYIQLYPQIYRNPNSHNTSFKGQTVKSHLPLSFTGNDDISSLANILLQRIEDGEIDSEGALKCFFKQADILGMGGRIREENVIDLLLPLAQRIKSDKGTLEKNQKDIDRLLAANTSLEEQLKALKKKEEELNRREGLLDLREKAADKRAADLEGRKRTIKADTRRDVTARIRKEEAQKAAQKVQKQLDLSEEKRQLDADKKQLAADRAALNQDWAELREEKDKFKQFLIDTRAEITKQVLERFAAREEDLKRREVHQNEIIEKKVKDAARCYAVIYGHKDDNITEYVGRGEQMIHVGNLVNNHPNIQGDAGLTMILTLIDIMKNKDGHIPVDVLDSLDAILIAKKEDVDIKTIEAIIRSITDKNGDLDLEKSSVFLGACTPKFTTLRSVLEYMEKEYPLEPADNEQSPVGISQRLQQERADATNTIEEQEDTQIGTGGENSVEEIARERHSVKKFPTVVIEASSRPDASTGSTGNTGSNIGLSQEDRKKAQKLADRLKALKYNDGSERCNLIIDEEGYLNIDFKSFTKVKSYDLGPEEFKYIKSLKGQICFMDYYGSIGALELIEGDVSLYTGVTDFDKVEVTGRKYPH